MVKAVVDQARGGRGSIPSWAKGAFKLVTEWKKRIRNFCNHFEELNKYLLVTDYFEVIQEHFF